MQTPNTGLVQSSYDQKIKSVDFVFKTLNNRIKDKIDTDVADLNSIEESLSYIDDQIQDFLSIEKQFETFGIDIVGAERAKQGYCDFLLCKQLIQHLQSLPEMQKNELDIKQRSQVLEKHSWFFKTIKEYIAKTAKSSFQSTIESRFNSLLNGGFPIIEKAKLIENVSQKTNVQTPILERNSFSSGSLSNMGVKNTTSNLVTHEKPRSISTSLTNQLLDQYSQIRWINMETLLSVYYEYDTSVLLIDFRTSYSFKENHISLFSNIINIEPISVKPRYTIEDIYSSSLLLASYKEKQLFQKLSSYELIILLDDASSTSTSLSAVENLVHILYDNNPSGIMKPKRRPVFLNGGYCEFSRFINNQPKDSAMGHDLSSIMLGGNYIHTPTNTSFPPTAAKTNDPSFLLNSQNGEKTSVSFPVISQSTPLSKDHQISTSDLRYPKRSHVEKSTASVILSKENSSTKPFKLLKSDKLDLPSRSSSPSRSPIIVSGLYNLGNSCYMNSVLQCMIATKELTNYLLNENYQKYVAKYSNVGSKGLLTNQYHDLAVEMLENSKKGIATTPKRFKKVVGDVNGTFRNNFQQDAAEFLHFLLDTIHEDLNWSSNKNSLPNITAEDEANRELLPLRLASTIEWERYLKSHYSTIIETFAGQYASRLECLNCHKTSTTYVPYNMLSVPIPSGSSNLKLTDCLDKFVCPEFLKGENVWKCNGCNSSNMTKKKLTITRFPRVLIIHLERFTMSRRGEYVKNNCKIEIPSILDLNKYWPNVKDANELEQLKKFPDRNQSGEWKYKLFGIVRHYGTLNSGHYISEVCKNEKWVKFDDNKVVLTKVPHRYEVDGSAYILFYQRLV